MTSKTITSEESTARLELLEARACVTDLVYRYAQNIRTGKFSDCLSLFTDDAVFEVREAPLGDQGPGHTRSRMTGHEAILSYLTQGASSGGGICPLIHNLLVDVNGHEAASSCVMMAIIGASGKNILGAYQDSYRYDCNWRFTARIFTILAGT